MQSNNAREGADNIRQKDILIVLRITSCMNQKRQVIQAEPTSSISPDDSPRYVMLGFSAGPKEADP